MSMLNTWEEIVCWLDKYGVRRYTINEDLSVDVAGGVFLSGVELDAKFPVRFGEVSGNFHFYNNNLTSLEGCPIKVGGDFNCCNNKLVSLYGSPVEVGGGFYCGGNKLLSLKGCPVEVGDDFHCTGNNLSTLDDCPKWVGGRFSCHNNENLDSIFKDMEFQEIRLYIDNKALNCSLSKELLEVEVKKIIGRKI